MQLADFVYCFMKHLLFGQQPAKTPTFTEGEEIAIFRCRYFARLYPARGIT